MEKEIQEINKKILFLIFTQNITNFQKSSIRQARVFHGRAPGFFKPQLLGFL
jgi:hypothetical protein